MIFIKRTRDPDLLSGFTGEPFRAKLNNLLGYYYTDGGKVDFKPKTRQIWGKAKKQLKQESFDKCAYCEASTAVVAHGDVEHFRPKSEYWWLAYCYDNYTFSCQICNQTYKGNTFAIDGAKLPAPRLPRTLPDDEAKLAKLLDDICPDPSIVAQDDVKLYFAREDAHLPDPYLSDPEELFGWEADEDLKEVRLVSRTKSKRARRAASAVDSILGLNREELRKLRWNEYMTLKTLVLAIQDGTLSDGVAKSVYEHAIDMCSNDKPFAGMKRYFMKLWEVD